MPKKGRGKGAIIPSDPVEILKRDKFYEEENEFKAIVESLGAAPFNTCLLLMTERTSFSKQVKALLGNLGNITKTVVKIQVLSSRRSNSPAEVTDTITKFRMHIKHMTTLLSDLSANQKVTSHGCVPNDWDGMGWDGSGCGLKTSWGLDCVIALS